MKESRSVSSSRDMSHARGLEETECGPGKDGAMRDDAAVWEVGRGRHLESSGLRYSRDFGTAEYGYQMIISSSVYYPILIAAPPPPLDPRLCFSGLTGREFHEQGRCRLYTLKTKIRDDCTVTYPGAMTRHLKHVPQQNTRPASWTFFHEDCRGQPTSTPGLDQHRNLR